MLRNPALRKPYLLIAAAWLLHFVAWFLPVIKPGEFRPAIPGWQAFRYAACGVWACKGVQFDAWYYAALSTISAITALFFYSGFTVGCVARVAFTSKEVCMGCGYSLYF
jgi:hypothetical protein